MNNNLHILWTNADPLTAHHMVMMYATNSMLNSWWDNVTVVIWGATAKYVAEDKDIQEKMKAAQHAGVKFSACISCANNLEVKDKLEELDIEVIRWGEKLSNLLKDGEKVITV